MQLIAKLGILADAAKYDASCASSGAPKRSSRGQDGIVEGVSELERRTRGTVALGRAHFRAPN